MNKQITLPSLAPGCTMQLSLNSLSYGQSVSASIYQALGIRGQTLVQLVFASGDSLQLLPPTSGTPFYVLWLVEDDRRRVCFEIDHDTAVAIADFAGLILPAAEVAA